jgi:hypothetical protein
MQHEILAYLQDGYYAQGVALLRRCAGVAPMRLRYFEGQLSKPYVPTSVENELGVLLRSFLGDVQPPDPLKGEATDARASEPPRHTSIPHTSIPQFGFWASLAQRRDLPDAIMELRDRAIELHKRESLVHAQMGVAARAGKKKEAYELAKEIMEDIRPELDGIYDAVREWEKSGKLAVKQMAADSPAATVLEQMKRLKYCNERVSRIKGWIADGYREKTVQGQKARVLLDAKDVQELDNERLGLLVEGKEIKEKLGI